MPKKLHPVRQKHVPQRTCVACRESKAKRELTRVVRTVEGAVVVDESSKRPGRGAYVCHSRSCWDQVLHKRLLEYALKTPLTDIDKENLQAYYESISLPDDKSPESPQ